jgi:diguanylate cyclase (GGDEF)-like protein
MRDGVTASAVDVIIRSFAAAVSADDAALLGAPSNGEIPQPIARLDGARGNGSGPTLGELAARAIEMEQTLLEPGGPGNGNRRTALGVAVPVRAGERTLGAIEAVFAAFPVMPMDRLQQVAESYAQVAALCLDDDPTLPDVLAASGRDALTGCLSYARLLEVLDAEVKRSQRFGHALSCCFVDLDRFKRVNDRYGHLTGNRVLARVGAALRGGARRYDTIGRFGGDEFVIVLPETGVEAAAIVAERARSRIDAAVAIEAPEMTGVCIGIAEWGRENVCSDVLDAADEALAEAKHLGGATVASLHDGTGRFHVLVALGDDAAGTNSSGQSDPVGRKIS